MSLSEQVNVGARIKASIGREPVNMLASAATTSTGITIDRQALGRQYYSCKSIVAGVFHGNSTAATGAITAGFQHSSDGTSWDNYSTDTAPAAGSFVNTTNEFSVEQSVNLVGARRYVRQTVTIPTFSSSSSGNSISFAGIVVFGGADTLPAV